jgi:hypothetical protein
MRHAVSTTVVTLLTGFSFAVGLPCGTVHAQTTAAMPPMVQPDVQVVVAPLGDGRWGISEVYPKAVTHSVVQQRMSSLSQTSGWPTSGSDAVSDRSLGVGSVVRAMDGVSAKNGIPADPLMSSISTTTTGNVVDLNNGTIDIAPFLVSLRELNHVNVVYLIPPGITFPFHGLRHYEDAHVAIDLTVRQGTFLYTANIKDHGLTMASLSSLPRIQDENAPVSAVAAPAAQNHTVVYTTGLIIALAIGAGLLVYLWAMKLGGGGRRD